MAGAPSVPGDAGGAGAPDAAWVEDAGVVPSSSSARDAATGHATSGADTRGDLDANGAPADGEVTADGEDPADGAPPAPSCDYLTNTAPVVNALQGTGAMPTYTQGGAIADGTYWLTAITAYTYPNATRLTFQETVEIFGTSWNNVLSYIGIDRRATEILSLQGGNGTLLYTCDSLNDSVLLQTTVSFTYEVDGTTLRMADQTDGYLLTYERQ